MVSCNGVLEFRELFMKYHAAAPAHPSSSTGYEVFSDVWVAFMNDAYQGMFCEFVARYGYPLKKEIIDKSPYMKRPILENDILSALRKREDIILIGCEGSGKTTLCHYTLGYRAKGSDFDGISFLPINVIAYTDASIGDTQKRFFYDFLEKLSHAVLDKGEEERVSVEFDGISAMSLANKMLFKCETPEEYCIRYCTYLAMAERQRTAYLFIDNIDSVSATVLEGIFAILKQFRDNVLRMIQNVRRARGLDERKEIDVPVRFIVSVRTPTYVHVQSVSHGLFPLDNPAMIQVEDDLRNKANVWDIIRNYLFVQKKDELCAALQFLHTPIGHSQGVTISRAVTLKYLRGLVNWLDHDVGISSSLIKNFCGRSIRRYKMYGMKLLGHSLVWSLYERCQDGRVSRQNKQLLTRVCLEAMYDFSQPIGSFSSGDLGQFHLNPYGVVRDSALRQQNPLLGVQIIYYLKEHEQDRRDVAFASGIEVGNLIAYLNKIGYARPAVSEAFFNLRMSGLLRPAKGSKTIIEASANFPEVVDFYVLDEKAFKIYYDLINATDCRVDDAMTFIGSATRRNYRCGFAENYYDVMSSCITVLVFICDLLEQERRLKNMLVSSNSGLRLPSYVYRVSEKLLDRCGHILDGKRQEIEKRREAEGVSAETDHDRLEIIDCATNMLQYLRNQISPSYQPYLI